VAVEGTAGPDEWERLTARASRAPETKPLKLYPAALARSQFIRCYGGAAYRNATYGTRDSTVPWQTFWEMFADLPRVYAMERLSEFQAVVLGIAAAFAGKDSEKVSRQIKKLHQEAFPV
jgi:hypothetical protein